MKTAFFLFVLATIWALLPAFTDLKLGFPRSWITVALAALGWVLTLFAWLDTFDVDFSVFGLLGFLTATAILVFSVLALLPELRNRPALSGGLANAAQWANQRGPEFGQQQGPGLLRPAGPAVRPAAAAAVRTAAAPSAPGGSPPSTSAVGTARRHPAARPHRAARPRTAARPRSGRARAPRTAPRAAEPQHLTTAGPALAHRVPGRRSLCVRARRG